MYEMLYLIMMMAIIPRGIKTFIDQNIKMSFTLIYEIEIINTYHVIPEERRMKVFSLIDSLKICQCTIPSINSPTMTGIFPNSSLN